MSAIWKTGEIVKQSYPTLQTTLEVDDVIIGAGITGLVTALKLIEAGRRVAVIEAATVADNNTGNSTGNLYATLSGGLAAVQKKWDGASICQIVSMRDEAVSFIEKMVSRFSLDCGFKRVPLYWCTADDDDKLTTRLQSEFDISIAAGLQAQFTSEITDVALPVHHALRIANQAQYNPFRFSTELARVINSLGGLIFERSQVVEIDPKQCLVRTKAGQIRAVNIVQATHTPKGVNILQAEMQVFREYGIAVSLGDLAFPEGIYWMLSECQSVRTYEQDGQKYLVVIGEKHKTGKEQRYGNPYDRLFSYVDKYFSGAEVRNKWSAQQYKSADLLPYIGRSGNDNVFVATGFAADGLVWGAVAADIVSHQILGKSHPGTGLFNPRRFTPAKSLKNWVKESSTVVKALCKSYLTSANRIQPDSLAPGEARIVTVDGEKLAVYHSPDKGLLALSPVCPHMKCQVVWNSAETSWDCPCHGSRFNVKGEVLEGPACEPLQVYQLKIMEDDLKP